MIDTKALRSRVLDLAIQGKLTEQLPEDGTAEELYAQIQEEKQRLIKEGKIKKEKPLPEIKPEEVPFDIPGNWKCVRFCDANFIISNTLNPLNNPTTQYELYSVPNYPLKKPEILYGREIGSTKQVLFDNDILVCKINPRINRVWVVTRHTNFPLIGSSEWIVFRNNFVDAHYLSYYFLSPFFRNYMLLDLTGVGGSLTRAKPENVKKYPILLPPLPEQKRIVARVEEIFRLLDTIDAAQAQYAADAESLKAKLITAGIQGRLTEQLPEDGTAEELYQQIQEEKQRLIKEGKIKKEKPLPEITEDEVPFEIPGSWKWVRLCEIISILGDGIHGTPKYNEDGDYFFINGNNLSSGKIVIKPNTKRVDEEEYLKYKKELNGKTILVSINGTLGNLAFYNNEKVMLGKSACYFNLIKQEMKDYMYYLLQTDYFLKYAHFKATGVTIKNVSLKAMNEFCVPLPPLAVQKRIVGVLDEVMRVLDGKVNP